MTNVPAMPDQPIRVVLLTPPGRGAVATLLVAGQGAVTLVDRFFHPRGGQPLSDSPTDRLIVGRFGDDAARGEEIVAHRADDGQVLLHCHGGVATVERIQSILTSHGAIAGDWPAWAAGAYADRLQVESLVALSQAATERTAAILLDQHQGALRAELTAIEAALAAGDTAKAAAPLSRLLAWSSFGLHLTTPWRVVLAGPPNAGKSSLANAILGYQRAIVHHSPGTTRDVLTAPAAIEGWPVELIDTAGLAESNHSVEAEGIRRARAQIDSADLVLLVFDRSQPFTVGNQSIVSRVAECPRMLVIHNKSDLPDAPGDRPEGLATSALTGDGLPVVLRQIGRRLVPAPPAPAQAIPWTRRQIDLLGAARAALAGSERTRAAAILGEI